MDSCSCSCSCSCRYSFHQTRWLQQHHHNPSLHLNSGLLSCTETLGFESSDFQTNFAHVQQSPCCCSSSFNSNSSSIPMKKRSETKEFPPPLTSMNENGRRNFVLRSERKNGRLEIVKVAIDRPELLYATRQNGRLTLQFVRCVPEFEDNDEFVEEEDEIETEHAEDEEEEEGEEETEEEEWKVHVASPASVRRCYRNPPPMYGLGQQQRRCVTTM